MPQKKHKVDARDGNRVFFILPLDESILKIDIKTCLQV